MSMTTIGKTVGDIVRSPYIITGHASIKAPYFNAPRDGAEDLRPLQQTLLQLTGC